MTLSLYEGRKHQRTLLLHTIIGLNIGFGASCILFWPTLSEFLADALQWATWHGVQRRPDLFDYPFVLLWMLPLAGIATAWFAEKSGNVRLARTIASMPIVLLAVVFGWYHFAPPAWH